MTASPRSYQPLSSASHFVFESDVRVANKLSSGLAKGRYQAVFESTDHMYYLGEPASLLMPNGARIGGGIALPKADSSKGCHLFIRIGDDSHDVRRNGMGLVVSELAKLEEGRIREFKDDPSCSGFMDHIHVVSG